MTAPYQRAMMLYDIIERHKAQSVDFAAPADFRLRPVSPMPRLGAEDGALMYCFDAQTERAWFTLCDDTQAVLRAPFLYEAQFLRARHIVTVPFEQLAACVPAGDAKPIFVFSIGRCGSTLFSAMLGAVGVRAVSEPDVISQLAQLLVAPPHGMAPGFMTLLVSACVGSLRVHCGTDMVIKLRSQCNHIAVEIMRACPDAACIFMLRGDRVAWARSRYRAFGETPAALARMLAWGIDTFHRLSIAGCRPKLVWYEDVRDAPDRVLRDIGVGGTGLNAHGAAMLQGALARDSQDGSHLSRDSIAGAEMPADDIAAFDAIWAHTKPEALIERHGLSRLQ